MTLRLEHGPLANMAATTAYALWRLRSEVFIVEQACAYDDLDGRDLEPGCLQLWIADGPRVIATARLLTEPGDMRRLGRLCVAADRRSEGLAGRLIENGLDLAAGRAVVLDAQSHLEGFYERFGFAVDGPRFVEDGIEHTPMRRPAR